MQTVVTKMFKYIVCHQRQKTDLRVLSGYHFIAICTKTST